MGSGDGGTVEVSPEALYAVWQALTRLKGNDSFHEAIDCEEARKALRHWSGEKRLPPEECEEWEHNPRIMSVLRELRQLQHACQQASMKVPLQAVLARQDELELGGGARLKDGKLVQPSRTVDSEPHKQVGADSGEEAEAQGDEDEQGEEPPRNKAATKQMMWQFAAVLVAALATKLALWISPGDWESEIFGLNLSSLESAAATGEVPS
mmetsp:Transcript_8250/g.22690  ORF Transcript_8250/g.22690 Transcript_8250/m.22690 type:complete len:209 (+) Transcript_8250:74-700(+)